MNEPRQYLDHDLTSKTWKTRPGDKKIIVNSLGATAQLRALPSSFKYSRARLLCPHCCMHNDDERHHPQWFVCLWTQKRKVCAKPGSGVFIVLVGVGVD